jgi:hypothetical protein
MKQMIILLILHAVNAKLELKQVNMHSICQSDFTFSITVGTGLPSDYTLCLPLPEIFFWKHLGGL